MKCLIMKENIIDSPFEIQILRQHWIKDDWKDDKADLCSHGKLFLKIWDKVLSDKSSDSWSLSTAWLYLLRSLKKDYKIWDFGNYLIPCCGHFIIPHEQKDYVSICGCNIWIDWNVTHKWDTIELSVHKEPLVSISKQLYINKV